MPVARSGVAKRYAEAIFGIARDHDSFDRWAEELASIAELQEQPMIGALLTNPAVGVSAKERIAAGALPNLSQEAANLVKLLLYKGRFDLARQIESYYRRMVNDYRGIATAQVVSAVPLTSGEMRAVEDRLSAMTGRKVVVEASTDPSIIGGIVARIGDELIDASVKGRLEALKKRLVAT